MPHSPQQLGALCPALHVRTRLRRQIGEVVPAAVAPLKGITPASDLLEEAPSLRGEMAQTDELGRRRRVTFDSGRPVILLHVSPERFRIRRLRPHATCGGHRTTGSQHLVRLGVTQLGIDPVHRVEGDDGIGLDSLWLPIFECTRHHLGRREPGEPPTGYGCQLRAQFDCGDGQAALGKRHSRLAGTAADLDYPVAGLESRLIDQVVEQTRRTYRPGPLIVLSGIVKPGTEATAFLFSAGILKDAHVASLHECRVVTVAQLSSRNGVISASTSALRCVTPTCVVPGSTASCALGRSSKTSTTSCSGEKSR